MINNAMFLEQINAPIRTFRGRVEFSEGSTLTLICGCDDHLKSFTIERAGESSKFFGYGICQKISVELIDRERAINLTKNHTIEVEFGKDTDYIYPCPRFYINDIKRDETTNGLTITAYDALYEATKYTVSDLELPESYTIAQFVIECARVLGLPVNELSAAFNTYYPTGANFSGTETLRDALNAVAEATRTIYFVDKDWRLTFKYLDIAGDPVLTIDKSKYFSLKVEEPRTLKTIFHATELGDNASSTLPGEGVVQYVRDNPFWDMRDDTAELVANALTRAGGTIITPFECSWRGNFLLEIGDKIGLITKDDNEVYSYVLNDAMTFNGALSQKSEWEYEENESETADNPTTINDAISQTYAKVDKVNKQIDLMVSEVSDHGSRLSQLEIGSEGITARVESIEITTNDSIDAFNESLTTLTKTVETKMTSEQVSLEIKKELANGVDKVETSTGYVFDETGLTVSKSGSEMTTQITEDGMTVYRDSDAVLTANNTGVNAENLHATTYLMIGSRSRFENYESNRTGCFWIGGID